MVSKKVMPVKDESGKAVNMKLSWVKKGRQQPSWQKVISGWERHHFLLIFDFQTCRFLCIEEITEVGICYIFSGHGLFLHILYTLNLDTQKVWVPPAVGDDQDCAAGGKRKIEISGQILFTALILLVTIIYAQPSASAHSKRKAVPVRVTRSRCPWCR